MEKIFINLQIKQEFVASFPSLVTFFIIEWNYYLKASVTINFLSKWNVKDNCFTLKSF